MDNQKSGQTVRFVLLFIACFFLTRSFFNPPKPSGPLRAVPTLQAAFAGIDTLQNRLNATAATAEIAKLDKAIGGFAPQVDPGFLAKLFGGAQQNPNHTDEYSYWARLRAGLLQQYIFKDKVKAIDLYTQVAAQIKGDAVHAQALYQKGDLLWHTSKEGTPERQTAATTLEALIHQGRGSSKFLDLKIYIPRPTPSSSQNAEAAVMNPQSFGQTKVGDLRGTYNIRNPEGLPDRVDTYYSKTTFHIIFDEVVRLFGNNREYSYGLALLFFAVFLRVILQPVTKKQYSSMKGMAEVAPDIKKIQEKYKEKPEKQMDMLKETRELYKAKGVNPQLGCVLGLVQLPIFFLVVYPLIQHYEAKMELTGASFLWIANLSRPDIPLLIFYAVSQFLSFRLSATPPPDAQQAQVQAMMAFIMPITIPFFLWTYPSAFVLYWAMFNVVSTFFQWRLLKAGNPDRSALKAIFESPMAGVRAAEAAAGTSTTDALPSRPNKSSTRDGKNAENGFNGTRNGNNGKNGTGKNGTVLQSVSAKELREMNGAPDNDESAIATATQKNNAAARRRRRKRR